MALLQPLSIAQATQALLAALEDGEDAASVAVVSHPSSEMMGARVVFRAGTRLGSLGDSQADAAAEELAKAGLAGSPKVLTGLHSIPLENGESCQVYLELHHPQPEMVVVGAGHVAQPLCTLGALLGLRVRVLDDRPQFATRERFPEADEVRSVDFGDPFADIPLHQWSHVVLVTRGHRYDYECLRKVLERFPLPGYIGMIGSRRRVRATFDALLQEGFQRELLARVHAPIGLDLGGETPAEIAVSVAAEIVHHWNGGSGQPLSNKERILERFHPGEKEGATAETGLDGPDGGGRSEDEKERS
jgi:xanthine dehydrogenase accessory factor